MHDIRNPTQALTLIVEFMHEEPAPGDDPPDYTIREATRHLTQSLELLDRVLRVPHTRDAPAPVSLRDHLEFLGLLCQAHRSPATLDLTPALGPSLPAVRAVNDHLEHALLNLVVNAVEACADRPEGHITISAAAANGDVVVAVEDTGRGVAEEVEARLFQPFVTSKTDRPFAGLGLAVARELIGRTGGTVTYDPEHRPGARFVLTLPVWK